MAAALIDNLIEIQLDEQFELDGRTRWTGKLALPGGRPKTHVVVTEINNAMVAFQDQCPHQGNQLSRATVTNALTVHCERHSLDISLIDTPGFAWPVHVMSGKFYADLRGFKNVKSYPRPSDITAADLEHEIDALRQANATQQSKILDGLTQMDAMLREVEESKLQLDRQSQELLQLNQTMQRINDTLSDALLITDTSGHIISINAKGCEELNAPQDKLVGASLDELLHPDLLDALRQKYSVPLSATRTVLYEAIYNTSAFEEELTLGFKDSLVLTDYPHHLVHGTILYSADGKEEGLILIASNISNLKRREIERVSELEDARGRLRKSESRFKDFAETASDWMWEMDEDLDLFFVSSSHVIEDFDLANLFAPNPKHLGTTEKEREAWRQHQEDLHAHRPFSDFEFSIRVGDEIRHMRMHGKPIFSDDGTFLGYRGTGQDITAASAALEELRKLSRAVEQSAHMTFITDVNGNIEYINPKFTEFTGYSADEVIGRNPRFLQFGQTPHEVYVDLWDTILAGHIWRHEMKDRRKDGSVFWAAVTITPVRDSRDEITHFIAMHEDITHRKLAEEKIRFAMEEAEIANRAKSELLANMSHELRTPLNAIIGFSEAIKSEIFGPLGSDKYSEYNRDILESGSHLLELINDILDVSAIEAGKVRLQEEYIDLNEIVSACIRLVTARATSGQVKITQNVPEYLPKLYADARRLKQILLNLASNAVKFTPEGGEVKLTVQMVAPGTIQILITDNGVGMAVDELQKALEQFGQVDSGLNRKHEGTGLGLPLTKALCDLHGATFNITSAPQKGTSVVITFPRERVQDR